MPQVEFHILSQVGDEARLRHVCALVLAYQQQQQRVFIRAGETELRRLDELLWTWHDQAFIPHEFWRGQVPTDSRIVAWLGTDEPPTSAGDSGIHGLINLLESLPATLPSLARIQEVIDGDATRKQQGRERYKRYRELGCELSTHNH